MNQKARNIAAALEKAGHTGINVEWREPCSGWCFKSDQHGHEQWCYLGGNVSAAIQAVNRNHNLAGAAARKGAA